MQNTPKTLGDALARRTSAPPDQRPRIWVLRAVNHTINLLLLTALTTIPIWWAIQYPNMPATTATTLACLVFALWLFSSYQKRKLGPLKTGPKRAPHPLLAHDTHGFMQHLKLAQKTAVFDGSNLFHFGLQENVGARAVALIAAQLRTEGYRVVCFFDANIHYTLIKNGVVPKNRQHAVGTLEEKFGLQFDEIYVVPAGTQADKFILDCLSHLPVSFAVTNDRFRDFAKLYPSVMKGDQWRKGIMVSKNEIKIVKHRFASPVYLS